jgi:hypothetical protein
MADNLCSWRAIAPDDRVALQRLNDECFPLHYEESFYDLACNGKPGHISLAAFESGVMIAAIVLRYAPSADFEDCVVSRWFTWTSSWNDPVSKRSSAVACCMHVCDCLRSWLHTYAPLLFLPAADGRG